MAWGRSKSSPPSCSSAGGAINQPASIKFYCSGYPASGGYESRSEQSAALGTIDKLGKCKAGMVVAVLAVHERSRSAGSFSWRLVSHSVRICCPRALQHYSVHAFSFACRTADIKRYEVSRLEPIRHLNRVACVVA